MLYAHDSKGISLGKDCSIGSSAIVSSADGGKIYIGDGVMIGPRAVIVATNHAFSDKEMSIRHQGYVAGTINIESGVWIGSNCVILSDVTIGKGSVIGAGAVVTKNVPAMEVWGGVPAKFIKSR
jgi:acetyltransferase-like isoleucine patch superfamily enzyme